MASRSNSSESASRKSSKKIPRAIQSKPYFRQNIKRSDVLTHGFVHKNQLQKGAFLLRLGKNNTRFCISVLSKDLTNDMNQLQAEQSVKHILVNERTVEYEISISPSEKKKHKKTHYYICEKDTEKEYLFSSLDELIDYYCGHTIKTHYHDMDFMLKDVWTIDGGGNEGQLFFRQKSKKSSSSSFSSSSRQDSYQRIYIKITDRKNVILSYQSENKELVEQISKDLNDNGIDCCIKIYGKREWKECDGISQFWNNFSEIGLEDWEGFVSSEFVNQDLKNENCYRSKINQLIESIKE